MAYSFSSPGGGTTSLPQYLQQRQPGSTQPAQTTTTPTVKPPANTPTGTTAAKPFNPFGSNAAAAGAGSAPAPAPAPAPTPTPYPVSGTGNPTIPTAPPPAPPPAPAPAAPPHVAGDTGQAAPGGPIPLEGLRGFLEQLLGNSNRYDDATVKALRESQQHDLEDTRRLEEDRLRADAASRGLFHSTNLSTSLGDASQRYVRGLADAEANLQGRVADARAQDRQNAISNVFTFGQGEQNNQRLQADILGYLMQLGSQGGPTIPGSVGAYGDLPQPGAVDNSYLYQLLGSLFGPKPAPAAGGVN